MKDNRRELVYNKIRNINTNFRAREISEELGIDNQIVKRLLMQLSSLGIVRKVNGNRKNAEWRWEG